MPASKFFRPEILRAKAYAGFAEEGFIRLDAHENPYPLPQSLREKLAKQLASVALARYPDPTAKELKKALRQQDPALADWPLIMGNGSDELIQMIFLALPKHSTALGVAPSFSMYEKIANFCGVPYETVPLNDDFSLPKTTLEKTMAQKQPGLVLLATPNNPTGNAFDHDVLLSIIEKAPGLVMIDEAYLPFSRSKSFVAELARFEHLVVLRTLSKVGLAGLRIGYLAAAEAIANEIEKIRLPYNVGTLNQEAAIFVLEHFNVLKEQIDNILAEREKLAHRLRDLGLQVFPSQANFLLVKVPDAGALYSHLKKHKILVKNLHGEHPLLNQCLRISVGLPEDHDMLLVLIESYLHASRHL